MGNITLLVIEGDRKDPFDIGIPQPASTPMLRPTCTRNISTASFTYTTSDRCL
jgi:hypothetical protein